jgi:hypothetical protein
MLGLLGLLIPFYRSILANSLSGNFTVLCEKVPQLSLGKGFFCIADMDIMDVDVNIYIGQLFLHNIIVL